PLGQLLARRPEGPTQLTIQLEQARQVGVDLALVLDELWLKGNGSGEAPPGQFPVTGNSDEEPAQRTQIPVAPKFVLGEVDLDPLLLKQKGGRHRQRDGEAQPDGSELVPDAPGRGHALEPAPGRAIHGRRRSPWRGPSVPIWGKDHRHPRSVSPSPILVMMS